MTALQFIRSVEKLIAEQQAVQAKFPPASEQWQNASSEIHRLSRLVIDAQRTIKEGR
jgi:hypothetical protein